MNFSEICQRSPDHGFLALFEGIDGTGKSTQARRVTEYLTLRRYPALLSEREPNSFGVPQELDTIWRRMLADGTAQTRPYVFQAYGLCECLEPQERVQRAALESGAVVVADRGFPSFWCYGLELGCAARWLEQLARPLYYPDIAFIFLHKHVSGPDFYERNGGLQERVRQNYQDLAEYLGWFIVPPKPELALTEWIAPRIIDAYTAKLKSVCDGA